MRVRRQLGSVEPNHALITDMVRFLRENKIDVFSIDPFTSTHAVHENDNTSIRRVVEIYDSMAEAANCAVHVWHHIRKGGTEVTVESARGAGSFVDALRSVRMLETMSKEEAKRADVDESRRRLLFKVFNGKLNFAPPDEKVEWRELVNIELENSGAGFGDDVGVAKRWLYPSVATLDLSESVVREIIREVGSEVLWRDHPTSPMWVGKAVGKVLGLEHEEDRVALKGVIKRLKDMGALREEVGRDHKRQSKMFVIGVEDWSAPDLRPGAAERGSKSARKPMVATFAPSFRTGQSDPEH